MTQDPPVLHYTMDMETENTPLTRHLEAWLVRQPPTAPVNTWSPYSNVGSPAAVYSPAMARSMGGECALCPACVPHRLWKTKHTAKPAWILLHGLSTMLHMLGAAHAYLCVCMQRARDNLRLVRELSIISCCVCVGLCSQHFSLTTSGRTEATSMVPQRTPATWPLSWAAHRPLAPACTPRPTRSLRPPCAGSWPARPCPTRHTAAHTATRAALTVSATSA